MAEIRKYRRKRKQGGAIAVMVTLMVLIVLSTALLFLPDKEDEKKNRPAVTPTTAPGNLSNAPKEAEQLAVVLEVDTEVKMITVYDVLKEEQQNLVYTGATTFFDGYGIQLTAAQLVKGGLYRFTIDTKEEWISTAKEAVDRSEKKDENGVWEKTGVDYLTISEDKISFRDQNYRYSEGICVMNNGKQITLDDLKFGVDILTIRGQGQVIYEIVVTKGHGYITLENQEDFIGGTITIGSTRVDSISEDSVYTVREGTYEVIVERGEYKGTEKITVERDKTTVFDVFEYGHGPVQTCMITVSVDPLGATLYVNGEKTYYTDGFELDYGTYEFEFTEGGYTSYKAIVQVNQPKQTVYAYLTEQQVEDINGDDDDPTKDPGDDEPGTSGDETSTGTDTGTSGGTTATQTSVSISGWNRYELDTNSAIYILGPAGAEVYLDSEYLGIAPIDFEKIIGSYQIMIIRTDGSTEFFDAVETDNGEDSYYDFGE